MISNNYIKVLINRMARSADVTLTDRHELILEYAYNYYKKNNVGPLYYNLKKQIGVSRAEINTLFPHGLNSVYSWVGIPIQSANNSCKPIAEVKVDDYREVYLDHNSTTYLRPEVQKVLSEYYDDSNEFANPSSATLQGKKAFELIDSARTKIADCLRVFPEEIVFTGCGSESNNLAIKGIAFKHLAKKGHLITSKVEHTSVLKTMQFLESFGFAVSYLDVENDGRVSPDLVKASIRENTILVSIMAVNNEIGMINSISEIGSICSECNIPFMSDAVQGFGRMPLHPREMGLSLMSLSGHKIYAPKGIGALYIEKNIELLPLIHGGGQEWGMRAGTENVGEILAFGKAAEFACAEMKRENARLLEISDYFVNQLTKIEPDFVINGTLENRVPHNLSIGFPGVDSASLLLSLNLIGISVSTGSACGSGKIETSHVLKAIEADIDKYGFIRFSFGLRTTSDDLDYLFKYLPEILRQIKEK